MKCGICLPLRVVAALKERLLWRHENSGRHECLWSGSVRTYRRDVPLGGVSASVRPRRTPEERQARREQRRTQRRPAQDAQPAAATVKPDSLPVESAATATTPAATLQPAAPVAATPLAPSGRSASASPGSKADETADLRLNFRGVPLDMVLNYLSEAAGFIIVLEAPLKGNVDVWSNQPLNKTEAVNLLNTVLDKNGLTAIRNDRTLTIVSKEDARKRNVPVKMGSNPQIIPKNEEVVTQILMAIPLQILYEVSVWVAWYWERRDRKRAAAEAKRRGE